jgi:hypothetical protein
MAKKPISGWTIGNLLSKGSRRLQSYEGDRQVAFGDKQNTMQKIWLRK